MHGEIVHVKNDIWKLVHGLRPELTLFRDMRGGRDFICLTYPSIAWKKLMNVFKINDE